MARRATVRPHRRGGRTVKAHSRKLKPRRAGRNAKLAARRLRQKQYAAGSLFATAAAAEMGGWLAATVVAFVCLGAGLLLVGGGEKLRGWTK